MKVLALVSGGKDSAMSMVEAVAAGHTVVAMANLRPKDRNESELDSYMFQTVGHEAIEAVAEAAGIPLLRGDLEAGSSLSRGEEYQRDEADEVEALFRLVSAAKEDTGCQAVCSGAILSDYQRIRVEDVCSRLGLVSLSYLWRRDQGELLTRMVETGIGAALIKVASLGLDRSHLGKTLGQMQEHLKKMESKFGLNVCGEGGEFETFTMDSPIFSKEIKIDESEVVEHSADAFAPVAYLKLKRVSTRDKKVPEFPSQHELLQHNLAAEGRPAVPAPDDYVTDFLGLEGDFPDVLVPAESPFVDASDDGTTATFAASSDDDDEGWFCACDLEGDDGDGVAEATAKAFRKLEGFLSSRSLSTSDLCAVTLLVSSMSAYAGANAEYAAHFGANPPVRVCVEAPARSLKRGPVRLTAVGCRRKDSATARRAMHVQSVSHWAPANIGPYSQAVEVDGVVHVAGQIALVPGSMRMLEAGALGQAMLGLRHADRVLRARGASERGLGAAVAVSEDISGLVYR